jgi:iron complex outermembrane receptor protein
VQQALRGCPAGSTTGCVPLNIFGPAGSDHANAQLNFLGVTTSTFTYTKYRGAQGVVSGDLGFASPFANTPIGVAVGAEYRKYEAQQFGDLPVVHSGRGSWCRRCFHRYQGPVQLEGSLRRNQRSVD